MQREPDEIALCDQLKEVDYNSHLSAADIAAMRLPGVPNSKRGVNMLAARSGWLKRAREGRGGGWEYAVSSLPEGARHELFRRLAEAHKKAQKRADRAVQKSAPRPIENISDMPEWRREIAQARALIVGEVARMAQSCGGIIAAERAFAAMASAGQLSPRLMAAAAQANARKGDARTVSAASLRRWRAEAEAAQAADLAPAAALAPKAPERAPPPDWLHPLLQLWATPLRWTVAKCLEELKQRAPTLKLPPLRTAQQRIKDLGALARSRGRIGPRGLKALRPYVIRNFDSLEPLDVLTSDGHCFKAEVRHPVHGRPFRPEVVATMDIATRRVVGWSAGLAEGAWLAADSLRMALGHGLAAIWYTDHGAGFENEMVDDPVSGICARIGMKHEMSIPWNAQARGAIERLNATLWGPAAQELPTYNRADREARQKVHQRTRADLKLVGGSSLLLSWEDFQGFVSAKIDAYNARPHSALPRIEVDGLRRHMSPNERWTAFEGAGWAPIPIPADELDALFRPSFVRTVSRGYVRVGGGRYFARELDELDLHGREVLVGVDIHSPERVLISAPDGRRLCWAELDGNSAAYMPSAQEVRAQQRAEGRLKRLETQAETVRAELGPPSLQLAAVAGEVSNQKALTLTHQSQGRLRRRRAAAPVGADTIDPFQGSLVLAEGAAVWAQIEAAKTPPRPPPTPQGARPIFADDTTWARWLLDHPEFVTEGDRDSIKGLLKQPSWRRMIAADLPVEALARLAAGETVTLTA